MLGEELSPPELKKYVQQNPDVYGYVHSAEVAFVFREPVLFESLSYRMT